MAIRGFLFKESTIGFFKCTHYHVFKRTLIHPDTLGVTDYLQRRRVLNQILGDQKEKFISRIEHTQSEKSKVFKDDVRTFLHLADTKELQNLCIRFYHLYRKQHGASEKLYDAKDTILLLKMLYCNEEIDIDVALHEFYMEKVDTGRQYRRKSQCFVLIMDMLYKAKRYEDVTRFYAKSKEYFHSLNWLLICLYFGSQYKLGTREAFDQVQTELKELLTKKNPLLNRCLFLGSMLAFKQGEYAAMLEMQELPIFDIGDLRWEKENNLKLLAYVHLDREEEAVSLLQSVFVFKKTDFPVVFLNVLDTVKEKVLHTDNVQLKASMHEIELALKKENLIRNQTFESFYESLIGPREIATRLKRIRKTFD